MDETQTFCLSCKSKVMITDVFCHSCGKKIKDSSLATNLQRQLTLYFISFFLPYFAIWPAIRYLKQQDATSKKIGTFALILIIASILLSISLTKTLLNSLNSQLEYYQGLN